MTWHVVIVSRDTGVGKTGGIIYTRDAELFDFEYIERQRTLMGAGGSLVVSEGTLRLGGPALKSGTYLTKDSERIYKIARVFPSRATRASYALTVENGKLVIPP